MTGGTLTGLKFATDEVERLRAALREIKNHWGEPMPLDAPHKDLMRKWQSDYRALQAIARAALRDDA